MYVRIGLVVVALALLALLSLGIGLGTGYVRITSDGIAWGKEADAPDPSASNTVSADDLLKRKGVAYVDPQQPVAPPAKPPTPEVKSGPAKTDGMHLPAVGQHPENGPGDATAGRSRDGIIRVTAASPIPIKDPAGNVWEAANGFDDGEVVDRGDFAPANTRFTALYRYERCRFTRWRCRLPNGKYTVLFHFAETSDSINGVRQRVFAVSVQGETQRPVDIFAESGGIRRELIRSAAAVVSDGTLTVKFHPLTKQFSTMHGIEVIPNGPVAARVATPEGRRIGDLRICAGRTAAIHDPEGNIWFADTGFSGGEVADRGSIPIANTAFQEVYQNERYGMTAWRKPVPNGNYLVNLHFAETSPSVKVAGQRVFNVIVQDQPLRDLDVCKEAGGKFRALVKTFHVSVTGGEMVIRFQITDKKRNVPEINGIEVIRER